jgi:hypothetical protein
VFREKSRSSTMAIDREGLVDLRRDGQAYL